MEGRTALSWLSHATDTAPPQTELDRLDYERSVARLGELPGPRGVAPPYLENPIDTYASLADQDEQLQAELASYDDAPELDQAQEEAERAEAWLQIVNRHQTLSTLRAAMEHATGRPILQKDSYTERQACGFDGELQEHSETGRRRFVVYRCHHRDRCPECAVGYGEERGKELASLLDAVRTMVPERKGYPAGFGLEVTLPEPVTQLIGAALDGGDYAEARRLTRKLVKIAKAVTWDAVKRRGLEPSEVGSAINLHMFHSRAPVRRGYHVHAHVTIPNVTRDGRHLRRLGKLPVVPRERVPRKWRELAKGPMVPLASVPPEHRGVRENRDGRALVEDRRRATWLSVLRLRLRELILREYGAELDLSELGNVNLHWLYFGASRAGWSGFRKRAFYVNRSPWHDVAKRAVKDPGWLYSDAGLAQLGRFADRAEAVHHALKVRRYTGWLSPGQRGKWGLVKDDDGKSPWRALPNSYRRVIKHDATGVWLRGWDASGEFAEHVAGELVTWAPTAPPRRWQTTAQRAEKAQAIAVELSRRPGRATAVVPGLFGMVPA